MTSSVTAVWRHRSVLWLLVIRDLTVKYQQSVLGYLWSLIEPLAVACTYWFVFGLLYKTKVGPEGESYILFLVSGLFAWIWINAVLSEATTALTAQARLITTINMPREMFPIGRVFGKFFEYLAAMPVLLIIAVANHAKFGVALLLLPLAVLLQMIFLIGLSMLLASLNVMLRDTEKFIRLVQRMLFYALPIIYPLTLVTNSHNGVPHWVKVVYQANPLVGIFELHHAAWVPSAGVPPAPLLISAAVGSVLMLLLGWVAFRRLEPAVLKEL
ncbi:MAG: ABC transporter permease [Micromonosporaceae bacterium]